MQRGQRSIGVGPICPFRKTYEIARKKGQTVLEKASAAAKAMADKKG
jgi:hypothetical protein